MKKWIVAILIMFFSIVSMAQLSAYFNLQNNTPDDLLIFYITGIAHHQSHPHPTYSPVKSLKLSKDANEQIALNLTDSSDSSFIYVREIKDLTKHVTYRYRHDSTDGCAIGTYVPNVPIVNLSFLPATNSAYPPIKCDFSSPEDPAHPVG